MVSKLHIHLGKRIAQERKRASLSQQQLADKAGLALSTLTKIERGAIKNPSVFTVQDLARSLKLSLEELLGTVSTHTAGVNNDIRFIYFDVHGVIATNWHRVFSELANIYNVDPLAVEMVFWRYNDLIGRGQMSLDDFERIMAEQLRLGVERVEYRKAYFTSVKGDERMHNLLRKLVDHYDIGLFTNIFPGFLDKLIDMGVVPALPYAARIESCLIGAVKPEPSSYSKALEQTGTTASHTLLVDDTQANIDEAKRLGWRVEWYDELHCTPCILKLQKQLLPE